MPAIRYFKNVVQQSVVVDSVGEVSRLNEVVVVVVGEVSVVVVRIGLLSVVELRVDVLSEVLVVDVVRVGLMSVGLMVV